MHTHAPRPQVHFAADGDVLVGRPARRLAASAPATTYASVKRLIGRKVDDPVVAEEAPRLGYEVGGWAAVEMAAFEHGRLVLDVCARTS